MKLFCGYYCLVLVLESVFAAPPRPRIDYFKDTRPPGYRVVGGFKASRHQFPYQISLQHKGRHICGGALINETRVVTAAHCKIKKNGRYYVVAGMLTLKDKHEDVQKIRVKRFITHPEFPLASGKVETNDIAFLVLSEPVKLSSAVQLIGLPTKEQCQSLQAVTITGWGYIDPDKEQLSKSLLWANLPRITNKKCAENLITIRFTSSPLDNTMICTISSLGKNYSACNGDSGGPLVRDNVVVGVVSWGITPCGLKNAPTVAAEICSHEKFVLRASSSGRVFLHYIKSRFIILSILITFVYLRKMQC